jgi:hypothetical protein
MLDDGLGEQAAAADVQPKDSDILNDWLSEEVTAKAVKKTVRTLRKWRKLGTGPPYACFGRTVRYRRDGIAEHYRRSEITPVRNKQRPSRS